MKHELIEDFIAPLLGAVHQYCFAIKACQASFKDLWKALEGLTLEQKRAITSESAMVLYGIG